VTAPGGRLDGAVALRLERGLLVPAELGHRFLAAARAQLALAVRELDVAGHRLANVQADAALQDRELTCVLADGATLHGGPLRGSAKAVFPGGGGDPRVELRVGVRDADLDAAAVPWLRFPLPLLAGLQPDATLDFRTRATFDLALGGTFGTGTGRSLAERLRDLQGKGGLELRGGAFTPAPALRELLALARTGGQLRFDRIGGDLEIAGGAIRTDKLRFEEGARGMLLRGSTAFGGTLDWVLDVTELLRGHRDGDRVLAALGGKAPEVRLRGDVRAPSLAMFDVEGLLRQAAQGALQTGLKEALEKLLRRRERK
jgi:hypothetical protein